MTSFPVLLQVKLHFYNLMFLVFIYILDYSQHYQMRFQSQKINKSVKVTRGIFRNDLDFVIYIFQEILSHNLKVQKL